MSTDKCPVCGENTLPCFRCELQGLLDEDMSIPMIIGWLVISLSISCIVVWIGALNGG